uniref:Kit ligand n=1 Tax=Xiphophorus couchianus TaxID=32473 RepID=A0A3B5MFN9_9TELE
MVEIIYHLSNVKLTTCVLLGLFSSLHLCSGKFGTPITDDVSKLSVLKQNIPSDYEIPVGYIPREVAGTCWVVLNIYPLERSLEKLASMFGDMSSNRDDVNVFVTMLKSLRLTFDHEELETAMQVFQCHYREKSLLSGLYFDYIQDLLRAATQGTLSFSCKPQPCLNHPQTAGTPFICVWQFYSDGCLEAAKEKN